MALPEHTGLIDAVSPVGFVEAVFVFMVMALEVAGEPVTQLALLVIMHVNTSLFTKPEE